MNMEMNERNSFTGRSCHIDIRYFLIKDRVEKGELSIMYCPAHLILEYYFTKPPQGELCHKF